MRHEGILLIEKEVGDLVKRKYHLQRCRSRKLVCLEASREFKVAGLMGTWEGEVGQVGLIPTRKFELYPVGIWSNDNGFWNQIPEFHSAMIWVVGWTSNTTLSTSSPLVR